MASSVLKHSYTVPCASAFRDAVEALASRRNVNVGDLARSVLLVVPPEVIDSHIDPGDPASDDRETVILKSGPAQGRPWRRKPRLQVRMPPGFDIPFIRKALGLAMAMDKGDLNVKVNDPSAPQPEPELQPAPEPTEDLDRMRTIISVLSFEPLPEGVRSRQDALHVLGFPPNAFPDHKTVRAKFRMLATIHHPDSRFGNHMRMSQLNAAMDLLKRAC